MLTATETLKEACQLPQHREQGDAMEAMLSNLRGQGVMNSIEVRVMCGDKPDVHDRFLVADDDVFALGSSLNEFGQRGTMLIELADPSIPLRGIERAWLAATPFEAWLTARRATRAPSEPEGGGLT